MKSTSSLLKYPSAIPKTINGINSTYERIIERRREEYRMNPTDSAKVLGFTILLNPLDRMISPIIGTGGWHESEMTALFGQILKEGMAVIDVGANVGWFTLLAAKKVGRKGLVISIEPEPTNFALLNKSVEINRFDHTHTIQQAVADREGTSFLYLGSENKGSHSLVRRLSESSIPVRVTTLDILLSRMEVKRIDLLKIDVEGAEPQVIRGCRNNMSLVTNLIMEYNPEVWAESEDLLDELFEEFEFFRIVKTPFLIKTITPEQLHSINHIADLYLRKKHQ